MTNEKNPLQITNISFEDFTRLNLKGYEHRKHYFKDDKEISYQETGEFVTDSEGDKHWVSFKNVYSKLLWDEVDLNKVVKENIDFSREQGWINPICVAIHTVASEKDVEHELEGLVNRLPKEKLLEMREQHKMYGSAYLDKWLTRNGMQTYLIRCDVPHLYSKRNYFYTKDDYFEIDKRETKAVYLIHWN